MIDLISRLGLKVKKLKSFGSNGASVITNVNNGAPARLWENQI